MDERMNQGSPITAEQSTTDASNAAQSSQNTVGPNAANFPNPNPSGPAPQPYPQAYAPNPSSGYNQNAHHLPQGFNPSFSFGSFQYPTGQNTTAGFNPVPMASPSYTQAPPPGYVPGVPMPQIQPRGSMGNPWCFNAQLCTMLHA